MESRLRSLLEALPDPAQGSCCLTYYHNASGAPAPADWGAAWRPLTLSPLLDGLALSPLAARSPLPFPSPAQRPLQGDLQDSSHFLYFPLLHCLRPTLAWSLDPPSHCISSPSDSPHPLTPNSQAPAQPEAPAAFSTAKHTSQPQPSRGPVPG